MQYSDTGHINTNTLQRLIFPSFFLLIILFCSRVAAAPIELFTANLSKNSPWIFTCSSTPKVTVRYDSDNKQFLFEQDEFNDIQLPDILDYSQVYGLFHDKSNTTCQDAAWLCYYNGEGEYGPIMFPFYFGSVDDCTEQCKAFNAILYPQHSNHLSPLTNQQIGVIYNPVSGKKRGTMLFELCRELISFMGGTIHEFETTEKKTQLRTFLTQKHSVCHNFVVIGGDGTLHDVATQLIQLDPEAPPSLEKIAIIPAGSGNGIAASMQIETPAKAMVAFVRAAADADFTPPRLNIKSYSAEWSSLQLPLQPPQQKTQEDGFLLLNLATGVVADVDIGTEWLRTLGDTRIVLGALWNALSPRPCELAISTEPEAEEASSETKQYSFMAAMNVPYAATDFKLAREVKPEDENIELITVLNSDTDGYRFYRRLAVFTGVADASYLEKSYVSSKQVSQLTVESPSANNRIVIDGELISKKTVHSCFGIRRTGHIYPTKVTISPSKYYLGLMIKNDDN